MPAGTTPFPRLLAALAVVGSASTITVVAMGAAGSARTLVVAATVTAAQAFLAGGLLVAAGRRGGPVATFQTMMGAASLVLGVGAVVLLIEQLSRPQVGYPSTADFISVGCVPFVVAGMATIPRRHQAPRQGTRLLLEAVMLGALAALVIWRILFASHDAALAVSTAVVLTVDLIAICALFVAVARDPFLPIALAALGGVGIVTPDVINTYLAAIGETRHWTAAAVLCMSWPLLTVGLLQMRDGPPEPEESSISGAETRRHIVVSTMFVLLCLVFVVSLFDSPEVDQIAITLLAVGLLALWGRELIRAQQQRALLSQLTILSQADPLTQLGNRRALGDALIRARRSARILSLLTVDLDGFKDVNDHLGHEAGDRLLIDVAAKLSAEAAGTGGQVFRIGGDEFVVVSTAGLRTSEMLADRLVAACEVAASAAAGHSRVSLSASVGVAHARLTSDTSTDDLLGTLNEAGTAMRAAKRSGRGRVVVFDAQLAGRYRRRRLIESRLLSQMGVVGGVYVHFQPLVELSSGRMVGVEALARWEDEVLGVVGPSEFVGVAEECGLIGELGERILREALAGAVSSGLVGRGLSVAVNVSTLQLRVPGFVGVVSGALEGAGVAASQLVVEVTESVFVRPGDPAIRALVELSGLGVGLALDDFGTGYSSLGYLTRLPVRSLKLDRSLTSGLGEARTWAIARSVVEMAVGLGLEVVVEGVETAAQEVAARRLGAHYAQGWLYARAFSLGEMSTLLGSTEQPVVLGGRRAGLPSREIG